MSTSRPIKDLHNWDKNPRGVKKDDFERLKRLITKLGIFKPFIITEDGTVLGGNMRLLATKELIAEGKLDITEVPVVVVDAPTEERKIEFALADNDRVGYYEDQALAELVAGIDIDLGDYKVDLGQPISLAKLLEQFGPDIVEDEVPEVSGEPESRLGEVYQLGRHRLVCGDATNLAHMRLLMDDKKADMVFTDPPYGVEFQSNMRAKSEKFGVLDNDDVILSDWIVPAKMYSDGWFMFCTTWKVIREWIDVGEQIGDLTNMIIWDKGGGGIGDLKHSLLTDYEIILAYNRGNELTGKRLGSVWSFNKDNPNSYQHPTQKPVALPAQAIKTTTNKDDIVLDLFGGSGSTLIACEQTNRICYMMELDPKYCDVIRKRYAKFIGNEEQWETTTPLISK